MVRVLKSRLSIALIFAAAIVGLGFVTNVSTKVTGEDSVVFQISFGLKKSQAIGLSYDEELLLIKSVQQAVFDVAPVGAPIPERSPREPIDLIRNRSGLCFDRSRTFDKVFNYLGFKTRHVYILYPGNPVTKEAMPYWKALITRGTASHAVTEVKTQRGWVVVDSNTPWISVTTDGRPVESNQIFASQKEFENMPSDFQTPFKAYKGLYSRRGQFYRPYIPLPQFNWADYFNSFID